MTQIGLMMTVSGLVGAGLGSMAGAISDRIGRRRLLATLLAAMCLNFMVLTYVVWARLSFLIFAALWTVRGLVGSGAQPVMDAVVTDITPVRKRAEAYGMQRVGSNVGWGLGPAIGGFIMAYGYHWLFLMTACIIGLTAALAQLKIPETWKPSAMGTVRRTTLGILKQDRYAVAFLLVCLCLALVRGQLLATLSVHASGNIGLTKPQIGFIFFLNAAMVIAFQVPVARWTSRFKPLMVMVCAGLLYGAGYLDVGLSRQFSHVILAIAIVTVGELLESPTASAYISRLAPPGASGSYMGGYGLVMSLGWAVGPLVGGLLLDNFSRPLNTWIVIAGMAATSSLGFALLMSREKKALTARGDQGC